VPGPDAEGSAIHLRFRCANCGSDRTDFVVVTVARQSASRGERDGCWPSISGGKTKAEALAEAGISTSSAHRYEELAGGRALVGRRRRIGWRIARRSPNVARNGPKRDGNGQKRIGKWKGVVHQRSMPGGLCREALGVRLRSAREGRSCLTKNLLTASSRAQS
jgi:hypothetical protein